MNLLESQFRRRGPTERSVVIARCSSICILVKNPMKASTGLSMNGKSPMIATALRSPELLVRMNWRAFQQNLIYMSVPSILACQELNG